MALNAPYGRSLQLLLGVTLLLIFIAPVTAGAATQQRGFAAPQQAVDALIAAVQSDGDSELLVLLGAEAEDLISSGDKVADQIGRERFLAAAGEQLELEAEGDNRVQLLVGAENYPFPIPLVRSGEEWRFDTRAGVEEILNRRIGRNELKTIEVVQAYTEAQREYACRKFNGAGQEFAQKFSSSPGSKDGLYWPAAEGEQESPFGPLIAEAAEQGYAGGLAENPPEPFQGYYFKILKAQGEHATGGAFDYVANGKMILGFALVAYPAKYGASGIMTFIVNQQGVIYEKDLGETTAATAAALTRFDPDSSWRRYEETADR